MRRFFPVLIFSLSLAAGVGGAAALAQTPAAKAAVDAAKAQGLVGEQADGFLGLVAGGAPPGLRAAIADINAGRARAYQDIAAKTGVSQAAAGEATAQRLISRLPPGEYYQPLGGGWVRK